MPSRHPRQATGTLRSWTDLARLLERLARQHAIWIFRGEPSDTYELRPACGRQGDSPGTPRILKYDARREREALQRFKYDAHPYADFDPKSDIEWLALAQHHGMATRLLDWTENLLVAAFFAVEHAGGKGHALIYGATGLSVLDPEKLPDPFSVKEVCIYRPRYIDARIAAQRSVFTLHPEPTKAFSTTSLHRWVVTREACRDLKVVLDASGINYASLFPGLAGIAQHAGWRYKWGRSQGHVSARRSRSSSTA
jgi:hypothetical protein